jgi:hypothetical protein
MSQATANNVLLPTTYQPEHYAVDIRVDTAACEFAGVVTIRLVRGAPSITVQASGSGSFAAQLGHMACATNELVIHAKDLVLGDVRLLNEATGEWHDAEAVQRVNAECAVLRFAAKDVDFVAWRAAEVRVQLSLSFVGELRAELVGLYRSQYVDDDGVTRTLAATQLEPTHARRVFPCFDEPSLKAVFELAVTARTAAISNMPLLYSSPLADEPGFFRSVFAPTPRIPPYLLAILCGNFHYVERMLGDCPVRVYAVSSAKAAAGRRMLDYACGAIPIYEQLFGTPFPLPKLDLIALPDFGMAAMENHGAITFRETRLLVTAHTSSASLVAGLRTLCHEISHTWFGNLCTHLWWSDLWAKEGFARYCEFVAASALEPTWDLWDTFDSDVFSYALDLDSLVSTHPIEVHVADPDEIGQIFDAISYAKGACVIRMLASHIGPDQFREAVREYVRRYSYKNACTGDWFRVVGDVCGEARDEPGSLADVFRRWTTKPGFPVIKVSAEQDAETGQILSASFTQHRFFARGGTGEPDELWSVPLVFARGEQYVRYTRDTKEGREARYLTRVLMPEIETYSVGLRDDAADVADNNWMLVNIGQSSFCHVLYDGPLLSGIVDAICAGRVAATERLALHNSAFALALAGVMPLEGLFELISTLRTETAWSVWVAANTGLNELRVQFPAGSDARNAMDALVMRVIGDAFEMLCGGAIMQESTPRAPPRRRARDAAAAGNDSDDSDDDDDDSAPAAPPSARDVARRSFVPCRSMLVHILMNVSHPAVVDWALQGFEALSEVPVSKLYLVYQLGVRHRGGEAWHALWERFQRAEQSQEEQARLLSGMSHVREPDLFRRNLELLFSVRQQDASSLLSSMWVADVVCGPIAWAWFTSNLVRIRKHFSAQVFGTIVHVMVLVYVSDDERAAEVEAFFGANAVPEAASSVAQGLETARIRVSFARRCGTRMVSLVNAILAQPPAREGDEEDDEDEE